MKKRPPVAGALLAVAASCTPGAPPAGPPPGIAAQSPRAASVSLESLTEGRPERGFVALSRYVDGEGRARGARFAHAKTGFVLDYLAIETAPQAFVYVTTYPSSDRGEPHTQEHLLLGRGNKGRFLGNVEHTSLVRSSAFTAQYRTAYHFHTLAGEGAFWEVLPREIDAILHADYTDEEIRREVRDFGVGKGQAGKLAIEEKGTVYNEMVRSYEEPGRLAHFALSRMVYGPDHPLAWSSGGTPEGIRELTPEILRAFYGSHYRLDNMGMVVAIPRSVPLEVALERIGETLDAMAPKSPPPAPFLRESDLPRARGAAAGAVEVVTFPHASAEQPGSIRFAWPAERALATDDRILLELFMAAFAGGEGSRLYSALVDRKTRKLDTGATSVWAGVAREPGQVISLGLANVRATSTDEASVRRVRDLIGAELAAVAALPDGSAELATLGERVNARVIEQRRWLDKVLDTPPEFGTRGTYDEWLDLLTDVQSDPGFDKSLVRKSALARAESIAGETTNPWRDRIRAWKLDGVPYGAAARADPAKRKQLDEARAGRGDAELARLEAQYGTVDPQAALARRRAEIDRADEEIAHAEAAVPLPPLTREPPLTDDDLLAWREERVGGVPLVVSSFDTMKSVTVGLALRLDTVPEPLLPYVALLPSLIREVGITKDGAAIAYDQVRDRMRREVLGVHVSSSVSFASGRAELVVVASGNDVAEARRAIAWASDFLTTPDWRPENLARIKDVVNQRAVELGDVMAGPEEHWVERVEEAYWRQESPLLAHAGSFLTRAHDAFRISWRLEGGGQPLARFMSELADAGRKASRSELSKLTLALAATDTPSSGGASPAATAPPFAKYVSAARTLATADRLKVAKAGRDLGRLLADLPDTSLAADWAAVCHEIAAESGAASLHEAKRRSDDDAPRSALRGMAETLAFLRHAGNARAWIVGSPASQSAVRPDVEAWLAKLDPKPATRALYSGGDHILDRARARGAAVLDPSLVALVNASTANAAFVASARMAGYDDSTDGAMDLFLAANVPSGSGAHSFYKRIWGAGLAYSGYTWASPRYGRHKIYSDRCADLPSLLRFLDGEIRGAPSDPRMVEYAAARAFGSRVADTYETRAAALATDLAEGFRPERVRAFRERVLAARQRKGVAEAVHARILPAYAALLPTLDVRQPRQAETLNVIVGPQTQIAATEAAVAAARGSAASILRLYPRDFWYVGG